MAKQTICDKCGQPVTTRPPNRLVRGRDITRDLIRVCIEDIHGNYVWCDYCLRCAAQTTVTQAYLRKEPKE